MRPKLDLELGVAKKDDDLFTKGNKTPNGWRVKSAGPRVPPRKTFRRLGLLVLLAVACYVFIANIPTDLGPQDRRRPVYNNPTGGSTPLQNVADSKLRLSNDVMKVDLNWAPAADRNFDGPVRFLELADTLQSLGDGKGSPTAALNVLFAASSLSSASRILPMACQMAHEMRSRVHFALMSRNEISLQQLREINGIGEDCNVFFHGKISHFGVTVSLWPSCLTFHRCSRRVPSRFYR